MSFLFVFRRSISTAGFTNCFGRFLCCLSLGLLVVFEHFLLLPHLLHELFAMLRLLQLLHTVTECPHKELKHFQRGGAQVLGDSHLLVEDTGLFYQFYGYIITILVQHDFFKQSGFVFVALIHTSARAGLGATSLFHQHSKDVVQVGLQGHHPHRQLNDPRPIFLLAEDPEVISYEIKQPLRCLDPLVLLLGFLPFNIGSVRL